jgi:hypothetical protein
LLEFSPVWSTTWMHYYIDQLNDRFSIFSELNLFLNIQIDQEVH